MGSTVSEPIQNRNI